MSANATVDVAINWQPAFDVRDAGRVALRAAADLLLQVANAQVPVASGRLRDSGRVVVVDPALIAVVYDAPYATVVHERLDVRHPHGEAKWLERSAITETPQIQQRVSAAVRQATQ